MQRFLLGALLAMMAAGCSHSGQQLSTVPPPAKPAMVYTWAGDPATPPSARQFAQDKYACAQDYRMTQPAVPIQRDVVTELQLMTLHLETCLASKGWELRPVSQKPAPVVGKTPAQQHAPLGEPELSERWVTEHLPQFEWEGDADTLPSSAQYRTYASACVKEFPGDPYLRSTFDRFIMGLRLCMRRHGYVSDPVPDRDRPAEEPWPADYIADFYWAGEVARKPSRQQLEKDSQACTRDFTDSHLKRPDSDQMLEKLFLHQRACMKKKGYEAVPVPVVR